jgi:hypothetical protein
MRSRHLRRQPEPRSCLPIARAEDRRIHGDAHHFAPGLFGLPHDVAGELQIGLKVQLEPERRCRHACDPANRCGRAHAHDVGDPGRCCATRRFQLAIRMEDPLVGRRRQQDRKRQLAAEQRHARVDRRDVAQNSRSEPDPIECLTVPADRVFLRCPGGHVRIGHRRHRLAGDLLEFGEAQDLPAINLERHTYSSIIAAIRAA